MASNDKPNMGKVVFLGLVCGTMAIVTSYLASKIVTELSKSGSTETASRRPS